MIFGTDWLHLRTNHFAAGVQEAFFLLGGVVGTLRGSERGFLRSLGTGSGTIPEKSCRLWKRELSDEARAVAVRAWGCLDSQELCGRVGESKQRRPLQLTGIDTNVTPTRR